MDSFPRNLRRSHDALQGAAQARTSAVPSSRRSRPDPISSRFAGISDPLTPQPVSVAIEPPRNERLSIPAIAPPKSAAIPWMAFSVILGVLAAIGVLRWTEGAPTLVATATAFASRFAPEALAAPIAPDPTLETVRETAGDTVAAPEERADAHVSREGYSHIHGGVVFVPKTFASADGAYDLLLHFHGAIHVVLESAEHAELNAIVAVVNLGTGSGPYEDAYAVPGKYEALLDQIDRAVAARGVRTPHLRRVALSSWSAGYGAISTILVQRKGRDPLDAIAVLDGIHTGYLEDHPTELKALNLAPFVNAARSAAEGKILFTITHSAVLPVGYASTTATSDLLIGAVGGRREPADPSSAPEHLNLLSAVGAVSKKLEKWMEPESESIVGNFHVRGYLGNTPEHHMAHLLEMGATVLPELKARWDSQAN